MTLLARLAPRATKATVSSISSDGTFLVAPWWNQLLGWVPTRAGTTIDEQSALALPIVYACVRVIAESIASLPLITYRRTPEGGKERATDNPYYSLFHDAPNPAMTSFGWRETLMTHLTTWGNGYNEITETGFGTEVWPLPPHRMEVGWEGGRKVFDYLTDDGQKKRLDAKRVWHIPGLSTNGLVGLSPIQAHRESLGEMLATRDFGSSFYRNNARPAAVLEHPATLSAGAIERLATQMDQLRGTGNAGKTIVMEEGMKLHEVGVPPEDAQYIETRRLQREDVCSIYRMPPHMVGVLDHATFSNIEHQSIDFVVHTLRPWLVRIEQSIKAFFLADQPDIFVEFLVDGLLRGDAEARSKALAVQLEHEAITVNEWREIENRNPYPVNVRWTPAANYTAEEIDEDGNLVQPEAPPEVPAAAVPTPPGQPPQLTVIKSAAVRCAHERNGVLCNRLLAEVATPPYSLTCPRCKGVTRSTETKASNVEEPTADELRSVLADLAEAMRQQGSAIGRLAEREPVAVVGEAKRGGFRILKTAEGVSVEETA
jgi:HK97 family phage portal protein